MTISLNQIIGVAAFALIVLVVWAAIYSSDPDRREAAQRVLAIIRRRNNIPTVRQPRPGVKKGDRPRAAHPGWSTPHGHR
ncbi:hypothetical protein [Nocardia sp. GAS34]|uniref:hypothetical protein n=1 Tax=unclassified Nocardia TaxID=2637762 RepID=UPI003D21DE2A